jgi:hypothetical protein
MGINGSQKSVQVRSIFGEIRERIQSCVEGDFQAMDFVCGGERDTPISRARRLTGTGFFPNPRNPQPD